LPDVEELEACHETVHDVACNWKVMVENSLECYHCEPCHPGFAEAVDMGRYRSTSDGIVTIHTSERRRGADETGPADRFSYWYIWPTTEIDASPGPGARLSVFTRHTLGPDRFRLVAHYFRHRDDFPDDDEKRRIDDNLTLLEDIDICEAVQRGLASRGYRQGRFIVDEERSHISEHSVHHFQRLVAAALDL
jgi:phenylpropionate dioxygenase-like ring-hydroxylating dioxygenase large terminal subunit